MGIIQHKRSPYNWGVTKVLAQMEPMTVKLVARGDNVDSASYRTAASRLNHTYGVQFTIIRRRDKIYAVRLK